MIKDKRLLNGMRLFAKLPSKVIEMTRYEDTSDMIVICEDNTYLVDINGKILENKSY